MWLHQLAQTLQQDFLPSHCLTCHIACEPADLLCSSCLYSIRRNPWACQRCGQPGTALAGHCRRTTVLRFVLAGLEYSGVTRDLIHRWKFHGAVELSHLLVQLGPESGTYYPGATMLWYRCLCIGEVVGFVATTKVSCWRKP